ncbi:MAG: hypothetical protein AB8G95_00800 [Anaerolineae bacterium]
MFKTFDDILDLCLDRIEAGESVENCLIDYPYLANELKAPLEMANRFRSLPIQKPSLAADFHFHQQLKQSVPVSNREDLRYTAKHFIDFFKRLKEPIFELGFVAFVVVAIALIFMPRSNPIELEPTAILIAKETLTYADLGNMDYDAVLVGRISLKDGRAPLAETDEKEEQHVIHLDRRTASGDLDGDGWKDAAALLFWRDETATLLWSLVVVRNDQGEPKNVASIFLGPNLKVDSLEINNGLIHLSATNEYGNTFTNSYQLDRSNLILLEEFSEHKQPSVQQADLFDQSESGIDQPTNSILATNRLASLSYPIQGRTVLFKEGIVYGKYFSTRILDSQATYGDLTGDGTEESLAALLTQSSGSESIYFLSVVTDGDAEAVPIISLADKDVAAAPISSNSLGDQLKLDSVQVIDGEIVIELMTRDKGSLTCCSAMEMTYRFELVENELVALSTN